MTMHACPGQCGKVSRDSGYIHRHFTHSNKCQYHARTLAFQAQEQRLELEEEQELQRTLSLQLESSIAVEEDVEVPHTSTTRLPYPAVPLLQQDVFGEALAGKSGLPSEGSNDKGEWPNRNASVLSLPPSRKRPRGVEESSNASNLCNESGPEDKTAIEAAEFVVDLELAGVEESSNAANLRNERGPADKTTIEAAEVVVDLELAGEVEGSPQKSDDVVL
jgi:hypothetical protein